MMNDTGFFGDQQGGDLSRLFAECNDRIRMAGGELPALSDLRDILGPSAVMGQGHSDEDLALLIEDGSVALTAVNYGMLHDDASGFGTGEFDHLVWVCGIDRDPRTEHIRAFDTVDLRTIAAHRVPAERFVAAWLETGGHYVIVEQ